MYIKKISDKDVSRFSVVSFTLLGLYERSKYSFYSRYPKLFKAEVQLLLSYKEGFLSIPKLPSCMSACLYMESRSSLSAVVDLKGLEYDSLFDWLASRMQILYGHLKIPTNLFEAIRFKLES